MEANSSVEDRLAVWQAEREITRVVLSYARGIDQKDFERVRACFHADATLHYAGWFDGDLEQTMTWLEDSIPRLDGTLHAMGPPWIDLDLAAGSAQCETYSINSARYPGVAGGDTVLNVSGARYVDRFELRGGQWRICERHQIRQWARNGAELPDPPVPNAD